MTTRSDLAPIGLSTYARVGHVRKTIEALKQNTLAGESELFVFSDGPAPGHEARVQEVRAFVRSASGFRSITLVERETNNRVYNNRSGMKQLLDRYGKLIWVEEDIVTAPSFLSFMNEALVRYRDDPQVISICGYRPPIDIPEDYPWDAFALRRFSAWGFGTWADRFASLRLQLQPADYEQLARSWTQLKAFASAGWDMVPLLRRDAYGEIDALDVKIMFQQFQRNQYTIYPRDYLVLNAGHDGTGLHCVRSSRFHVPIDAKVRSGFRFPASIDSDPRIVKRHYRFRSRSPWFRLLILLDVVRRSWFGVRSEASRQQGYE